MIRIERLSKTYGRTQALTDITLEIAPGERLAIVGPSGSGRSTLLKILATLTPPTAGRVTVGGVDIVAHPFEVRGRLFYVGVDGRLADIRVGEYLRLIEAARPIDRRGKRLKVLSPVELGLSADASVGGLSTLERKKLGLAAAAMSGADLLLLDEPFRDFDAPGLESCLSWLFETHRHGVTIVATAGDATERHGLCDRVVHLNGGRTTTETFMRAAPAAEPAYAAVRV